MTDLSVINVYEIAADIRLELENVIDNYGTDAISNLMPHVVRVLEKLEALAKQRQQDGRSLEKLEEELILAKSDGIRKNEDNRKLQMDIQQLEELIKTEEMDLMDVADKIQRENRQLREALSEKQKINISEMVEEQETLAVLNKLKNTVDKQRDELRAKQAELRSKSEELEALQQQTERFLKINESLHRKNRRMEEAVKNLIHEKSQLQSQLAAMKHDVPPVEQVHVEVRDSEVRDSEVQDSEVQADDEPDGAVANKTTSVSVSSKCEAVGTDVGSFEKSANMQMINCDEKIVIDKIDPNRPRFTVQEMASVLEERHTMKLKVSDLEDELEVYRPKETKPLCDDEQRRERADSNAKRDRADSGIKKFFSGFLKKLSPHKKCSPHKNRPQPECEENVWEVLEPSTGYTKLESTELIKEEESDEGCTYQAAADDSNGVEEEVEEIQLQDFPVDQIASMPDGHLNESLDRDHFATAGMRSRGSSICTESDSRVAVEEISEENDDAEEMGRTENVEADRSQLGLTENRVDVNGNMDRCNSSLEGNLDVCGSRTSNSLAEPQESDVDIKGNMNGRQSPLSKQLPEHAGSDVDHLTSS